MTITVPLDEETVLLSRGSPSNVNNFITVSPSSLSLQLGTVAAANFSLSLTPGATYTQLQICVSNNMARAYVGCSEIGRQSFEPNADDQADASADTLVFFRDEPAGMDGNFAVSLGS